MKHFILFIAMLCSTIAVCQSQQLVDESLEKSLETQSIEPLEQNLKKVNDNPYWKAYNLFHQAVFHLRTGGDRMASEASTQEALTTLSEIENKNSEDYALLAMVQSFSMQFKISPEELQAGDEKFYNYLDKSISLDDSNPRAYYIQGMYEYYKPEQYGGSKAKAKELLEKAQAMFAQQEEAEITWGSEDAARLLNEIE